MSDRPASSPTSVLVADRQPLFREAVARTVRQDRELALGGEAEDGFAALAAIRARCPGVGVIAIDLDGLDGHRVLNAIVRDGLPTRVILIGEATGRSSYSVIASGARGWLSRHAPPGELRAAIRAAARGEMLLAQGVQRVVADEIRERASRGVGVLAEREKQIVLLVAEGRTTEAIATALHVSTATVRMCLIGLFRRLDVPDRPSLVALSLRRGWIE